MTCGRVAVARHGADAHHPAGGTGAADVLVEISVIAVRQ
jgi:hypothetical protein